MECKNCTCAIEGAAIESAFEITDYFSLEYIVRKWVEVPHNREAVRRCMSRIRSDRWGHM